MNEDLETHSKDQITIWRTDWMSPRTPRKTKHKIINWTEIITSNFYWLCFFRWRNLGKFFTDIKELEKLDSSEIFTRRLKAKEMLMTQKDGEFVFPVADGSAKLAGRDYEFQEPTLGREFTVRIENLAGKSHGDREEFQPEETKDDDGINKDFRAHAEARKEFQLSSSCWTEKFNCTCRGNSQILIHWVIDVTRSSYADLEIAQENTCLTMWMSTRTENCQIRGRVSQDLRYWTKLLREEIFDAGGGLEKSQNIWGKNKFNCFDIAGSGRSSVLYYDFAHEFVPMERSQESSVKASTCCLVSRHGVSVRQKFFE